MDFNYKPYDPLFDNDHDGKLNWEEYNNKLDFEDFMNKRGVYEEPEDSDLDDLDFEL